MGLGITLHDELGAELDSIIDPQNVLGNLLPEHDDPAHPMLASIDFYGDTVFNRMHMDRFLTEWTDIAAKASTAEEKSLMSAIVGMACRCRDEVHLYLKFIGDRQSSSGDHAAGFETGKGARQINRAVATERFGCGTATGIGVKK